MSKKQTIFSELQVALCIANKDNPMDIENVSKDECNIFNQEKFLRTPFFTQKIEPLIVVGNAISKYLIKSGINPSTVKWIGNKNIGSFNSVAKDIEVSNHRISIKENASVFINGSPDRIFIYVPQGFIGQQIRGEDWFIKTAYKEINDYFLTCIEKTNFATKFSDIIDYYSNITTAERKKFSKLVKILHDSKDIHTLEKYNRLCTKVSEESATIFNDNLNKRKQVLTPIFHFFFKINGINYILAGTEKNNPFAVVLPASDEWIKRYSFEKIKAYPNKAGQSEVILKCTILDKITKKEFDIDLKVEIRWSHGKFCGNPEAKVYKRWEYSSLPWALNIIRDNYK